MTNTTQACQCEHASHFWGDGEPRVNTPNGNPNHRYGVKYFPRHLHSVSTPYGTFIVCSGCASDCYAEYSKETKYHG